MIKLTKIVHFWSFFGVFFEELFQQITYDFIQKDFPFPNNVFRDFEYTLPKSAIGQAIQYALPRIEKLRRFTEQPYLQIDNNLVEPADRIGGNAIRPVAIGRKNYLFACSHEGAERAAMIYSFFGTYKLNNVNPQKWLADVLAKIKDTKIAELSNLLPANWKNQNN